MPHWRHLDQPGSPSVDRRWFASRDRSSSSRCARMALGHDRVRWADDGWASAESVLWDENGTLVAYATQMMLFTYLPD